jgi:hypothetical protein
MVMSEKKFERQNSVIVVVNFGFFNNIKSVHVSNFSVEDTTFSFEYIVNKSFSFKSECDIPQDRINELAMVTLEYLLANHYLLVAEAPKYFSDLATLPKYNNA